MHDIGVDFDNTIVCYDDLFHRLAVEHGLIPASLPASKGAVRDHLRAVGREDIWTELQGEVYGPRMPEAQPFPGVLRFFTSCQRAGVRVLIISHRTRFPYLGDKHDLHQAARDWLVLRGFHDPADIGMAHGDVHLELTLAEKLARIAAAGCSHFIDDLPEVLGEARFPCGVERILFDPNEIHADRTGVRRLSSWSAIEQDIFAEEA